MRKDCINCWNRSIWHLYNCSSTKQRPISLKRSLRYRDFCNLHSLKTKRRRKSEKSWLSTTRRSPSACTSPLIRPVGWWELSLGVVRPCSQPRGSLSWYRSRWKIMQGRIMTPSWSSPIAPCSTFQKWQEAKTLKYSRSNSPNSLTIDSCSISWTKNGSNKHHRSVPRQKRCGGRK